MTEWLTTCLHVFFVIDRVEPPYVIVEWTETALISEIPQEYFPNPPREGTAWVVHLFPDGDEKTRTPTWISTKEQAPERPDIEGDRMRYRVRISSRVDAHLKH